MTDNFTTKSHFPYTYGDNTSDEIRLSDWIVELMKTKKFQNHMTSVFFALLALGSYTQPSLGIPPEYGEAVNDVVNGMDQVIPNVALAEEAAKAANAARGNPIPNQFGQIGQGGRVNFNAPIPPNNMQVPAWRLPPAPVTPAGQYANTVGLIVAVGWICLNGAWGNPIFMAGCVGMLGAIANEGRKIIFK